jgi:hypothetical protein
MAGPTRNRNGPHVAALSDQVSEHPVLSPLKVVYPDCCEFSSAQPTAEQYRDHRIISLAAESCAVQSMQQCLALTGGEPIADSNPCFLTPFTHRMPAARSGLRRPASEASYASRRTAAKKGLIVEAA